MVRKRGGFTLIELLVVIFIVGILVALLLPAVQRARESARRMQCANNLKQIGIGLHHYHDALRTFPVSMVGPGRPLAAGHGTGLYSWLALLLPYVEQSPLADSINFHANMADAGGQGAYLNPGAVISRTHRNAAAAATVVPIYLCPSDAFTANDNMGTARPAPCNYCGNTGWPATATGVDGWRRSSQHNGVIPLVNPLTPIPWHRSEMRIDYISDGSSNTIAVTERVISNASLNDLYDPNYKDTEKSYCAGFASAKTLARYNRSCDTADFIDWRYTRPHGRAWISGWTLAANTYAHVRPINSRNCHLHGGEEDGTNLVSPSSSHDGGVNALMADGSVHFVMESIEMPVWWALGSRDGAESGAEIP